MKCEACEQVKALDKAGLCAECAVIAAESIGARAYAEDEYVAKLDNRAQRLADLIKDVHVMISHCEANREDPLTEAVSHLRAAAACLEEARV